MLEMQFLSCKNIVISKFPDNVMTVDINNLRLHQFIVADILEVSAEIVEMIEDSCPSFP